MSNNLNNNVSVTNNTSSNKHRNRNSGNNPQTPTNITITNVLNSITNQASLLGLNPIDLRTLGTHALRDLVGHHMDQIRRKSGRNNQNH
eukprot:UN00876